MDGRVLLTGKNQIRTTTTHVCPLQNYKYIDSAISGTYSTRHVGVVRGSLFTPFLLKSIEFLKIERAAHAVFFCYFSNMNLQPVSGVDPTIWSVFVTKKAKSRDGMIVVSPSLAFQTRQSHGSPGLQSGEEVAHQSSTASHLLDEDSIDGYSPCSETDRDDQASANWGASSEAAGYDGAVQRCVRLAR